jgi:hypothetical protein
MSDQRKIIRRAAAAHLMGSTDAGANVYGSRASALGKRKLPAICVYSGREVITLFQESPRQYKRELELRIEGGVEGSDEDDADDALDTLCGQIERSIGRSNCLTYAKEQAVAEIVLSGVQIEFGEQGSSIKAGAQLTYLATYYTTEPDEYDSEPVDALMRINTDYNLDGGQDSADRASDLVELAT